jgi:hypothetical protein
MLKALGDGIQTLPDVALEVAACRYSIAFIGELQNCTNKKSAVESKENGRNERILYLASGVKLESGS